MEPKGSGEEVIIEIVEKLRSAQRCINRSLSR